MKLLISIVLVMILLAGCCSFTPNGISTNVGRNQAAMQQCQSTYSSCQQACEKNWLASDKATCKNQCTNDYQVCVGYA